MIVLVRHPAVASGGRCYGRLDLSVDPGAVLALAAEIVRCAPSVGFAATSPVNGGGSSSPLLILPRKAGEGDHAKHGGGGLPRPPTIWTSPAQRCRLVAEALGAYRVDPRLQELDFGDWEGLPWDSVPRASLDEWAADPWSFAPPHGETGVALNARVQAFAAECATGDHVVITHGGPLKILTAILRGEPIDLLAPPPKPGAVIVLT